MINRQKVCKREKNTKKNRESKNNPKNGFLLKKKVRRFNKNNT